MELDRKIAKIREIQKDVVQFRHLDEQQRLETMFLRHTEFAEECPGIFEGVVKETLDPQMMTYMLNMSKNVEKGNLTFDQASVVVGQKLFDEYVKPVIGEDVPQNMRK